MDQHDRDIVLNGILEFTFSAYQTVFLFAESQIALALRANQYVQQFFVKSHVLTS